ncbi:MAG TPA: hypothetical protein VKZ70_02145 [Burkholderiaceae bacterium]|nr:hypothetical protein [Burkholderiaceae bacterium]
MPLTDGNERRSQYFHQYVFLGFEVMEKTARIEIDGFRYFPHRCCPETFLAKKLG